MTSEQTAQPSSTAPEATDLSTCGWRCGDPSPRHRHYAVLVRELGGKLLGRLTPDGHATNRVLFACVFSRARAEKVAQKITSEGNYLAKVVPF